MRIPDAPPKIKPAPPGERPLWSVMVPVYNCAEYLPELLNSVLPQAMSSSEMQIEVIDDCSTDADVEEIVNRIGKGRVGYYRQPENVGSLRNFETCINRAKGHYVHLLHGDDKLLSGFYQEMTKVFHMFPEIGAALCAHDHIDSHGNLRRVMDVRNEDPFIFDNWLEVEAEWQRTQYVAMVVKRSVYEKLGSFFGVTYGEDWEMWVRIAKHYAVAYNPKVLAQYREHDDSISGRSYAIGKNLDDITKVINTINEYLPEEKRKRIKRTAMRRYANYALHRRYAYWKRNREHLPGPQFFLKVLRMHTDFRLISKIFSVIIRIIILQVIDIVRDRSDKFFKSWRSILTKSST